MLYFWMAMTVVSTVAITFMGFTDGFNKWSMYYVLPVITLGVFFIRRFMMKNMEKHQAFLDEQKEMKEGKESK
jgi:hypothetical protein